MDNVIRTQKMNYNKVGVNLIIWAEPYMCITHNDMCLYEFVWCVHMYRYIQVGVMHAGLYAS